MIRNKLNNNNNNFMKILKEMKKELLRLKVEKSLLAILILTLALKIILGV